MISNASARLEARAPRPYKQPSGASRIFPLISETVVRCPPLPTFSPSLPFTLTTTVRDSVFTDTTSFTLLTLVGALTLHSLRVTCPHLPERKPVMSERIQQLLQATPLRDASPVVLIATAVVALPVLAILLNVAAQLVSSSYEHSLATLYSHGYCCRSFPVMQVHLPRSFTLCPSLARPCRTAWTRTPSSSRTARRCVLDCLLACELHLAA